MTNTTKKYNPLNKINDEQWIRLVEMLSENLFALNNRMLTKVEILYSEGGHYPSVYFRLTTSPDNPGNDNPETEVSGFAFGFSNDWDDDVYINPLTSLGYQEDWLQENGITSLFTHYEIGLRKLYSFLNDKLNLWNMPDEVENTRSVPNEWRELTINS